MTSQGDEITVTDGPFVEAKEEILGFALVEVSSHEEALEVSRRFRRIVNSVSRPIAGCSRKQQIR